MAGSRKRSSIDAQQPPSPDSLCPCGLLFKQHDTFFAGIITDKSISLTGQNNNVSNHLTVCSHPDIQLKCHNREPGFPSVENTLSYGAPCWRWQILAGPFHDYRAFEFIKTCGSQKRTSVRRLLQFIQLAIHYNRHKLNPNEQPLTIYLIGDISFQQLQEHQQQVKLTARHSHHSHKSKRASSSSSEQ